ncbi:MAG: AAA family ATPase [Candidatus Hydrogenedentota bacterium]
MSDIRLIVIVGSVDERVKLKKAFLVEQNFEVIGETDNAADGVKMVKEMNPSIILIDSELGGENPDGLACAETLSIQAPTTDMVMISTEGGDGLFLRKAMLAGVRQVLPKPYDAGDLVEIIKLVADISEKKKEAYSAIVGTREEEVINAKLMTIFSTKGGVGRSLIAINLACALKKLTGKKVALVDLDLQFGDVSIMMHIQPKNTIAALAREIADSGTLEDDVLNAHLIVHEGSGVSVLTAPVRPDEADLVKGPHIDQILRKMKEKFHYIVVDTPAFLSDTVLTSLELSDFILLLLTMELPTIKDGKLMMEIMQTFGYSSDKVKIIMNRESKDSAFKKADIEKTLEAEVAATIPSEGAAVMPAVNEGEPVYLRSPDSMVAKAMNELVKIICPDDIQAGAEEADAGKAKKKGGGLFGKKK